jgi:hypothetical protein
MGQDGKGKERRKGRHEHEHEHKYEAEQNVFRLSEATDRPVATEMAIIPPYG